MSSAWRATAFGASLYLLVGANLPYLPVWLETSRGFTGAQISAMIAAGTLIRIFAGPIMAARAEQNGLRQVLTQTSILCLLAFAALAPAATPLFAVIGCVTISYVAWGLLMPLADAALLSFTKDQRPDYGAGRAIASVCFIVASLSVGALLRMYGPDAAIWWLVGASALMVLTGAALPEEKINQASARQPLGETLRQGFRLYRDPRIFFAGMAVCLIQAAHAYYYNLGSNIWLGQGIGEEYLGALWSTGVVVEILFLLVSGFMFVRISPGALILIGGLGAVVRWTFTGFAPPLGILFGLQTLHALSFAAAHIGILRLLAEELPEDKVPVALAINSAVMFGPMLALLGMVSGIYYDAYSDAQARGYWLMAAVAALGCLCALKVVRRVQPQSAVSAG